MLVDSFHKFDIPSDAVVREDVQVQGKESSRGCRLSFVSQGPGLVSRLSLDSTSRDAHILTLSLLF